MEWNVAVSFLHWFSSPSVYKKVATIELALQSPIQEVVGGRDANFSRECMSQLDLCWYKINNSANSKKLPRVTIKGALGTLELNQVINVTLPIDERQRVENIDITLRGLPDNSS